MKLTKKGFTVVELMIVLGVLALAGLVVQNTVRADRASDRKVELLTQITAAETFAQADSLRGRLQDLSKTERLAGRAADHMAELAYWELEDRFIMLYLFPYNGVETGELATELARRVAVLKNHLTGSTVAVGDTCGNTRIVVMGFEIQTMLDSTRIRSLRKNFVLLQGAAKTDEPARDVSDAMLRDFDCLAPRLPNLIAARRAGFRYADFLGLAAKQGSSR